MGVLNGYEYVDLGLSVKRAWSIRTRTVNV